MPRFSAWPPWPIRLTRRGAPDAGVPNSVDAGATDAKSDAFHGFVLAVTAYEVNGPKEG